ncbi:MAG: hypothetical protein ABIS51_15725 [Sphingomonas sp.]
MLGALSSVFSRSAARRKAPPLPASLDSLIAALDAGLVDFSTDAVRQALAGVDGFDLSAAQPSVAGDALRCLLIALQSALTGRSTPLGFTRVRVTGSLNLDELVFDRSLIFKHCMFEGPVTMGSMACRSLTLDGSHLRSLDARVLSLRGNLFLRGVTVDKALLLRDATVEGVIDCTGSCFGVPDAMDDPALNGMTVAEHVGEAFGGSRIRARALFWGGITLQPGSVVTLRDAEIATLRDKLADGLMSWPEPGNLHMAGFSYQRKNPAPLKNHIAWLALESEHFVDNGRVLIACLDAANAQDDAALLAIEVQARVNQRASSRARRWSRAVYLALQRLAFHPERALALLLAMYLVSVASVVALHANGLIVPIERSVISDPCFQSYEDDSAACNKAGWAPVPDAPYALPKALQRFDGFGYAVDLLFPYAPDGRSPFWGGSSVIISILLLILRAIGLALQASLLWSLFGKRDRS